MRLVLERRQPLNRSNADQISFSLSYSLSLQNDNHPPESGGGLSSNPNQAILNGAGPQILNPEQAAALGAPKVGMLDVCAEASRLTNTLQTREELHARAEALNA